MLRVRPGDVCAAGLVVVAFAADLVLLAYGHDPISSCVRTRRTAKVVTLLLASHLVATIPNDPLTRIATHLTK